MAPPLRRSTAALRPRYASARRGSPPRPVGLRGICLDDRVTRSHRRHVPRLLASLVALCSSSAGSGGDEPGATTTTAAAPEALSPVDLLPLSTSKDRRIVDADG